MFSRVGLFSLILAVGTLTLQAGDNEGFLNDFRKAAGNPGKMLSDNIQLVHLARSLAHIPYISTVDSSDPTSIKTSAMLAASSSCSKMLYERLRRVKDYRLVYNFYHEPKLMCYLLAAAYDIMRFLGATEIALKNEEEVHSVRGFQVNQLIKLIIEICLRTFSFVTEKAEEGGEACSSSSISLYASEVADWVEVWRLLSRYTTYMNLSAVEANFNVSVKKKKDSGDANNKNSSSGEGIVSVGGSIDTNDGVVDFGLDNEDGPTINFKKNEKVNLEEADHEKIDFEEVDHEEINSAQNDEDKEKAIPSAA